MDEILNEILQRHESNLAERSMLNSQLEEIRQYVDPTLPTFTSLPVAGEDLPPRLDDTAVDAAENYCRAIHRAMTPAGLAWVQFEHEDPQWDWDWSQRQRLSRAEQVIQNSLDQSNFQAAMQPFWKMFGVTGTAFLHIDDRGNQGRFWFDAYSTAGVSFWDNADGLVDTIGREIVMTARQISQKDWNWQGVPEIAEAMNSGKKDHKFTVLHWIAPNENGWRMRNSSQKFVSLYILKGANQSTVLNERDGRFEGYEEFPVMVGRQIRVACDNVGRSRAFSIMGRIKELNYICALWRKGIELSILGFFKNRDGNEWNKTGDPTKINGGDILNFEQPDMFEPAFAPVNYGLAYQEIQTRQEQIREHFFWQELNLRREKYNMTTMELMQAQTQQSDLLAQQLSGAYDEVIRPMMERLLAIKMRSGEIEWPRAAAIEAA